MAGADSQATNPSPRTRPLQIATATVTNAVTIPEYSGGRLEWSVLNVPSPVPSLTSSIVSTTLQWLERTDVVYHVPAVIDYCPVRRLPYSAAGFQTCRIADFLIGGVSGARAHWTGDGLRVWKPARQQNWKSAVRRVVAYPGDLAVTAPSWPAVGQVATTRTSFYFVDPVPHPAGVYRPWVP